MKVYASLIFFIATPVLVADENSPAEYRWSLTASPNIHTYDLWNGLKSGGKLGLGYHLGDGWSAVALYEFEKYPTHFKYSATAGVKYLFSPGNPQNSFYVQADIGMEAVHVYMPQYRRVDRAFLMNGRFGKHFQLTDFLSYSPEISVQAGIEGDRGFSLRNLTITPLQFTLFF